MGAASSSLFHATGIHATQEKSYRTKIECAIWTTIFLGGVALLFSLFSNFWCHYASTTATLTSKALGNSTSIPLYHGIWNYQYTGLVYGNNNGESFAYTYRACKAYGDTLQQNSAWNAARAFSIVATVMGLIGLLSACAAFAKPKLWCCVSTMFGLACLAQGLTFFYFRSNVCHGYDSPPQSANDISGNGSVDVSFGEKCQLASAAKLGIASTVFFFVAALTACVAACQGRRFFERRHVERHIEHR
mmetsp:Transcript_2317/g.3542  ORF Transcript_2317/g.3542 Transcript_2317/m.3542 type:complete len:246 (+) Transcript_2317:158-895(+)|eukprot:CAMPEP_0172432642 /NCGR_PEP_ID=MMETSP1064-20121228/64334_1 /TAXON_ID=202472 /ORGANISM="Aulacoseira subarctica , Strain CCAP 1002/5" /LENGTH=245 /DNA_ID=CAMNT_0013180109 /DNA_START=147 /DNA_END=884 /DNA_ORIENTATION=+